MTGMDDLDRLLDNNRAWAARMAEQDPDFFHKLASIQAPEYLWIGCSDSRVPANQITGTLPGSIFVHRNIANLVIHTDMNLLSVLSFAVEVLKVKHIIVCGHYGCGGIAAALSDKKYGLIDNWLRHIRDTYQAHRAEFAGLKTPQARANRLVEVNVREQVLNLCNTTIIRESWKARRRPHIHGWVYDVHDGKLRDLKVTVRHPRDLKPQYDCRDRGHHGQ